jgi:hypothetical protein
LIQKIQKNLVNLKFLKNRLILMNQMFLNYQKNLKFLKYL